MDSIFNIREPRANDLKFIQHSFIESYRHESPLGRSTRPKIYYAEYQKIIDHLLQTCSVLIACDPNDLDTIYGYLVFEPHVAHYAFVKLAWCRLGIAKALVTKAFGTASGLVISHSTKTMKEISSSHPDITYNPFQLYKKGA